MLALALAAPWIAAASDTRPATRSKPSAKQPAKPPAKITYHTTLQKALKAAQKSKRPVLVYFHAAWCSPCKAMENTVLTDARVVGAAKQWEAVRADMDEESALAARLKVERPPALVFLTPQGRATGQHEGYSEVSELLKVLRVAHAQASTQAAPQKLQKSQKQSNQKQQKRASPDNSSR